MHIEIIVVGGIFSLVAIGSFIQISKTIRKSVCTQGKLVERRPEKFRNSGVTYLFPIIQFTTQDGREITFKGTASITELDNLGTVYPVRYDPKAPEKALIDTFFNYGPLH